MAETKDVLEGGGVVIEVTRPNPFVVPGHRRDPGQPLRPWVSASAWDASSDECRKACAQAEYYCDVGGHESAFGDFTYWAGSPVELISDGGVVVVQGSAESGKSALVNRCVQWIQEGLATPATPVHVLDFTREIVTGLSITERTDHVVRLINLRFPEFQPPPVILQALQNKAPESLPAIMQLMNSMRSVADKKHSFVLILPKLENDTALDEVKKYRGALKEGIVCFFEQVADGSMLGDGRPNPPLFLRLRHLTEYEAATLVDTWPNASTAVPTIPEATMREWHQRMVKMGANLTTGLALATLRAVFDARIDGNSEFQSEERVQFQEVFDTMVKVLLRAQGMSHS